MAQPWYRRTFDALWDHNFRWFWVGQLTLAATFQMGDLARGWLVYELTESAFALSWVSSGWSISTLLFSLYGGTMADRLEKRDLLIWTRLAMALNYLVIALLISIDAIQIWHLAVSSLLSGVLFSFMMPASQALLSELVDRDALLNAVSLNSVGRGLMSIFAAVLTGYLIEIVGVAGAYYAVVGFYLIAILTLTRLPRTGRRERSPSSVWADLREGVRYICSHSDLLILLGLALAWVLLGMPYRTFMPKFAQEEMKMDASGLGLLMAAPGVGALVSSLAIASLGNFQGKGKLLLASGLVLSGSLFLFANTSQLALIFLFLGLVGAAINVCMVINNTLLQTNSDSRLRGRVMSVYMMMWGLMPLGTLPAGAIADRMRVPFAVSLEGGLLFLIFLGVGWLWPRIRSSEL